MAGLKVYSKDGSTIRCTLPKYQYNGEYMGDRTITATINSPVKIDWEIGDYVFVRNQYFKIKATPAAKKQSRRNEYGAGIVYENVTFQSIIHDLVVIQFKDYVIGDNHLHYSGLGTFAFYMQNIDDLSNRILANLNLAYGEGTWNIIIATENVLDDNGNILVHGEEMTIRDQSVSISDGTNLHDALNLYNSMFDINYIVTVIGGVNTIIIGGDTTIDMQSMGYGDGRGLLSLTQSRDESNAIITRLHAYGSTRNMPYRYYNKFYKDITQYPELYDNDGYYLLEATYINKLMLPYDHWIIKSQMYDACLDSANITKYGIREGTVTFDGSDEDWDEIYPSIEGMSIDDIKPGMRGYATGAEEKQQTIFTTLQDWLEDNTEHSSSEVFDFLTTYIIDFDQEDNTVLPFTEYWEWLVRFFYAGLNIYSLSKLTEYLVVEFNYATTGRGGVRYSNKTLLDIDKYEFPDNSDAQRLYSMLADRGYYEITGSPFVWFYGLRDEGHWDVLLGNNPSPQGDTVREIDAQKGWVNARRIDIARLPMEDYYFYNQPSYNTVDLENGFVKSTIEIITETVATQEQINTALSDNAADFVIEFLDKYEELAFANGIYLPWSQDLDVSRNHTYSITQEQIDGVSQYLNSVLPNGNGRLDLLVEGSALKDNGVPFDDRSEELADTTGIIIEETFTVHIPQLFFNIADFVSVNETPMINMKSGMCAGRSFEILDCKECDNWNEGYILTLKRDDSDISTMNMYFPNKLFKLNKGDKYVLTGIYMPTIYVQAAEQRLLRQAREYLADYDHEVYQYVPTIDNQFIANHPILADFLQEGLIISVNDRDAGHDAESTGDLAMGDVSRYIKKLTIKYNEGYLPKYEMTLDENIKAVTLQKVIDKQIARRLQTIKS